MSSLIYSVSERNDLNVCIISKNESAFAHFREANKLLNSSFQSMKESFAILSFEKTTQDEEIQSISVEPLRSSDYFSDEMDINLQRMLGFNKIMKLDQGWGLSN